MASDLVIIPARVTRSWRLSRLSNALRSDRSLYTTLRNIINVVIIDVDVVIVVRQKVANKRLSAHSQAILLRATCRARARRIICTHAHSHVRVHVNNYPDDLSRRDIVS